MALDRGMVAGGKDCLSVRFVLGGSLRAVGPVEAESYTLAVSDKEVHITAADFQGFFNGLQTLRQLIIKEKKGYGIARCTIKDTPAFSVRGVMLDVGRNFASVDFIKKLARRLSHYKINMLHLHLTDDPGWRVEVKSHPELIPPPSGRPGSLESSIHNRNWRIWWNTAPGWGCVSCPRWICRGIVPPSEREWEPICSRPKEWKC